MAQQPQSSARTRSIREEWDSARRRFREAPAWVRILITLALIGLAALIPWFLPYVSAQPRYYTGILVKIGIAALLALGLNVVVGFAGLLDLGYVAFFAVGAYTAAVASGAAKYSVALSAQQDVSNLHPVWHMYFWLFFFLAIGIAMGTGVLLGAPTLRLRGDYLAIVTLGFGEIVRITANNLDSLANGPRGVLEIPNPVIDIGDIHYPFGINNEPYYYLLLAIIVIWIFLLGRLNDSRVGRAWAAVREDEIAAASMGVPTVRMKLWAFAIGAAVASLGGYIYASWVSFINPDTFSLFNISFGSVTILAMVVLGGMGGFAGPIVGAAMIIFLPEQFRSVGDARFLFFGLVLVIMMILRPQGLIPSKRRAAELKGDMAEETLYEAREHQETER